MEKQLKSFEKRYLENINPSYTIYNKSELQRELYKVLKSNEELSWFIKKLSVDVDSVWT